MSAEGLLQLSWRPYRFVLPRSLITSRGALVERSGWLLRLRASHGALGWGEAAAPLLTPTPPALAAALAALPAALSREALEQQIQQLPAPLACAVGMALAELDGGGAPDSGGWRRPPRSAWLLPAGEAALAELERVLGCGAVGADAALTVKWKVAALPEAEERALLDALLQRLPASARLRLDANGGWDLPTAQRWADRLADEPRLQWLEQPLAPQAFGSLLQLAEELPVALDESLPHLLPQQRAAWPGWLVRRPLQEGDPRPLLQQLQAGLPRQMISTAFETGIGRRCVEHMAALQVQGPTPAAPGLAPGWQPAGSLFAANPEAVWEAAA
ncbi:MAG: o-succinylbenzoate synthase [Cyanobacteriota bacterium]|jgi:O-succinylbenzoate synthase